MKNRIPVAVGVSYALISCSPGYYKEPSPNIVYILADDLGYGDLSCSGQQKFSTPNIEGIALEDMLFTQHYTRCNWKAVTLNIDNVQQGERVLYDLSAEIDEKNNIARHNPDLVRELTELLRKIKEDGRTRF